MYFIKGVQVIALVLAWIITAPVRLADNRLQRVKAALGQTGLAQTFSAKVEASPYLRRYQRQLGNRRLAQCGQVSTPFAALMIGLLLVVIGLILATIVIDTATTTGTNANIGSFTGVQSVNDLAPLVFISVVVIIGISLIGIGGAGVVGKGPAS